MLGAEDTAQRKAARKRRPRGRLTADSGLAAIEAAERMICGVGAVDSPSVAEGMALAGRRTAALPRPDRESAPAPPSSGAAWVDHRLGNGEARAGMAFTLLAGSAQEAVDHCLVAHRLADRLGRPGLCAVHPSIAGSLQMVRLPDEEAVAALFDDSARRGEAAEPEAGTILEAAREAFEVVSLQTQRRCRAVAAHELRSARHALLAAGPWRAPTLSAAAALREAGAPCAAVEIAQLAPFPAEELGRMLAGLETIVLLGPAGLVEEVAARIHGLDPAVSARVVRCVTELPAQATAERAGRAIGVTESELARIDAAPESGNAAGSCTTLGAVPAGPWSDRFLLDAAALMTDAEELALERPREALARVSTLTLRRGRLQTPDAAPVLDLLFAAHPDYLDGDVLGSVRSGGTVVVHRQAASPGEVWSGLSGAQRVHLIERGIELCWIDSSAEAERELLLRAFLAATGEMTSEALRKVEPTDPEGRPEAVETDFRTGSPALPRMPDPEVPRAAVEPLPALPLRPAVLASLTRPETLWNEYPLLLTDEGVHGMLPLFKKILQAMEDDGEKTPILREHVARLVQVTVLLVEQRADPLPLDAWFGPARDLFAREIDLSEAGRSELLDELQRFRSRLPRDGQVVGLSDQILLTLYLAAFDRSRAQRQSEFVEETAGLVEQLAERLRIDSRHAPEGSAADALAPTLGDKGEGWVDTKALSGHLPPHRGSKRLGDERRARIEQALGVLRGYLAEAPVAPRLVLVHPPAVRPGAIPQWARVIEHADALRASIGVFDGQAARMAKVLAAVRVARLEMRDQYDAGLHDAALAGFDWRVFNEDELCLMPAVAVLEHGGRLRGPSLAALSELLRSARPVQVLVSDAPAPGEWRHLDLGYLTLAHSETFALQSTLARPAHLFDELRRMILAGEPGVAVTSVPSLRPAVPPELLAAATLEGRSTPCFRYDASAGTTWADRFDLSANPQPGQAWPLHEYRYLDHEGNEQSVEEPFTFAHAAALDPAYRTAFRLVPVEAWSDDQIPLADYLASPEHRKGTVPYIWVVLDDGFLARAVVARELVLACLERARTWRTLQELGGEGNEYARRAAEAARREALEETRQSQERLASEQAELLEKAKQQAVGEAMNNLVHALMNLDSLPEVPPPDAPAPPPPLAPETGTRAAPVVEEKEKEAAEIPVEEPYIDEVLCTTCNECTNLNPKLFKYNENKQAYIADPSAGTFKELVLAAEKCPARCIHPGKPRKGDKTATDKMIARAARFN